MQIPFFPPKPPPVDPRNGLELLIAECIRQIAELRDDIQDLSDNQQLQGTRLMSAITDYAAKQAAYNARIGGAIDGLSGDIANLKGQIDALVLQLGNLSPEDQAALAELVDAGDALASRIQTLDDMTPPVVPGA